MEHHASAAAYVPSQNVLHSLEAKKHKPLTSDGRSTNGSSPCLSSQQQQPLRPWYGNAPTEGPQQHAEGGNLFLHVAPTTAVYVPSFARSSSSPTLSAAAVPAVGPKDHGRVTQPTQSRRDSADTATTATMGSSETPRGSAAAAGHSRVLRENDGAFSPAQRQQQQRAASPTAPKVESLPVLMPRDDLKFVFATLSWNVDLLLILLGNAPNPMELTEKREEEEAIRAMSAAERERKKRLRESVAKDAAPPKDASAKQEPPHGASQLASRKQSIPHGNLRRLKLSQPCPPPREERAVAQPKNGQADNLSLSQPQSRPTTWSERLARRLEDGDEEASSEEDNNDNSSHNTGEGAEQLHLRTVMSLPTLHDLEKVATTSASMRPSVLEARKHQQLDAVARANANDGLLSAGSRYYRSKGSDGWDTHHLLSLSLQEGAGGEHPFSLEDENADLSSLPRNWNSSFYASSVSEESVTTASTTAFASSTGNPSLRLLCGVDPQLFPTLEEVRQWLEKGGVRASAASFWRRAQERQQGGGAGGDWASDEGRGCEDHGTKERRSGSVGSLSDGGGDRVRRNRTFCFTATTATDDDDDLDSTDGKANEETVVTGGTVEERVTAKEEEEAVTQTAEHLRRFHKGRDGRRPPGLLPMLDAHLEAKERSPSKSPVAPQSQGGTGAVLRRRLSTESLLSLLSPSNSTAGGGPQRQDSRKGGKWRQGSHRPHGGRTMKVYVSSITEGPKAHLLYTAPTAEADQLYEQFLRLRQQQLSSISSMGGAPSSKRYPRATATPETGKKPDEPREQSILERFREANANRSCGSAAIPTADKADEGVQRRVRALLTKGAEVLRFQPWAIPTALFPLQSQPIGKDPPPPTNPPPGKATGPSLLSGAKLAFSNHHSTTVSPSPSSSSSSPSPALSNPWTTRSTPKVCDAVGTTAKAFPRVNEEEEEGHGSVDDEGGGSSAREDVDDTSTVNESDEPLFHLPARMGRRVHDGSRGPKARKHYFYGPRQATVPRVASEPALLSPSVPVGAIGVKSQTLTYSSVVRAGRGPGDSASAVTTAAVTSSVAATAPQSNATHPPPGGKGKGTMAGAAEAVETPRRHGDANASTTATGFTVRDRGSSLTPRMRQTVEEEQRKAAIHAFLKVFFRAFFVVVIAQIRLQDPALVAAAPPPPAPPQGACRAPQRPTPRLSRVEARALRFLQRHFASFKEVVVRYVMRSDQEVVRRSAQGVLGEHTPPTEEEGSVPAVHHRGFPKEDDGSARRAAKGPERPTAEANEGTRSAAPPRQPGPTQPRAAELSASSSPPGWAKAPSYRDALTAPSGGSGVPGKGKRNTPTSSAVREGREEAASAKPSDVDDGRGEPLQQRTVGGCEGKQEKGEACPPGGPPPPDPLFHSRLLHAVLSAEHVAALHQRRSEAAGDEAAAYSDADDVEPLAIEQLYLSGKDAAWQPALLDVLGVTRVLQCYPDSANDGTYDHHSPLVPQPQQQQHQQQPYPFVNVDLPALGVPPFAGSTTPQLYPAGNPPVPHQRVVLGALKRFLLQPLASSPTSPRAGGSGGDGSGADAQDDGRGREEGGTAAAAAAAAPAAKKAVAGGFSADECDAYLRYLLPYIGPEQQPLARQWDALDACSATGGAERPSCSHGLLDPLRWIPYAFLPSPYSTPSSNYSTELYVAPLPVSGRLLYRWVLPAEDTDKYNLSVFFQSSLFSFLQGGPVPAPTTESGLFIDFQQHRQQQYQQQQQQQQPMLVLPAKAESTLVHCSAGMHRSCGMVVAFLLWVVYQCAQVAHALGGPRQRSQDEEHSVQEAARGSEDAVANENEESAARADKHLSSSPPPSPLQVFDHLLGHHPPQRLETSLNDTDTAKSGSMAMMADASKVLLRAMLHVAQQRSMAEPIPTVQYLLKHFAAELQLP